VRANLRWENYNGSDIAIFQEILLEGEIDEVSEVLFYYRRKTKVRDKREHYRFLKRSNKAPTIYIPSIILVFHILKIIFRSGISKKHKSYLSGCVLWLEGLTILANLAYSFISKVFGQRVGNYFLRRLNRADLQPMDVGYKD
jgi:hypothetical protein